MSDVIGVSRPRIDAPEKVVGETRFAADDALVGLLHARLVLSTEAHALIENIDREGALAIDGVVAVLAADDLPTTPGSGRTNEPLAKREVVFSGQPVALVVAESEAAAEDGAEAVFVSYETLPAVADLDAALALDAPLARQAPEDDEESTMGSVHAAVSSGEEDAPEEELSGNVLKRSFRGEGDVEAAFAASDLVVGGTFRTPWVYQAYVEPQTATAWPEPGGTLAISSSTQGSFIVRSEVASAYGLELEQVRVRAAPLGVAFGG